MILLNCLIVFFCSFFKYIFIEICFYFLKKNIDCHVCKTLSFKGKITVIHKKYWSLFENSIKLNFSNLA